MIRFCTQCGEQTESRIPAGDNLPRAVCLTCGHIQYENPRLVVGCIAEWSGQILLCRRAIEPRRGYWTLPAGFMENGETTLEAARRETLEEAGAHVRINAPFAMINLAHINQVHLFYHGSLPGPQYTAGEESLEVALFSEASIPWQELSFRSVRLCLELYLADRTRQQFGFHEHHLPPPSSHEY